MSKQKTEVKVIVTSHLDRKNLVTKHVMDSKVKVKSRNTPSRSLSSDRESACNLKTPTRSSNTGSATTFTPGAATEVTPTVTTRELSDNLSANPCRRATSTLRTIDSQGTLPCHSVPSPLPCSSKGFTSRINRTPIHSSTSKNHGTNTPRQCSALGVPPHKRFQQEDGSQNIESSLVGSGCRQSKSMKVVESGKKDDDGRRKDNLNRILSSTSLNVPSPMRSTRVSCSRLSGDSKTSSQTKQSSGRSSVSSKISVGSGTPTQGNRRSSTNHPRYSNIIHPSSGGSSQLTPDLMRCYSLRSPSSSAVENHYGGAESTTVSVGVRVRPLSDREKSTSEVENVLDVVNNNIKVTSGNGTLHSFSFDHCFSSCDDYKPSLASQGAVYNTLAQPLLEKAYEGYNTCLFAYGQTGSGKSYTMLGEDCHNDSEFGIPITAGVIPRFCYDLFDRANCLHSKNPPEDQLPQCHVEVEISYIEIYNERIYDLLGNGGSRTDHREPLRVREHPDHGPYVEGVAHHLVSSFSDLQTWLLLGNKERSIAATGVNDKSSRSHAVFTIRLKQMQVEDVEGEQLESSKVSIINLVDLAGSERVAAAQSQGDRLKEGVCINKSLLTLGKVITALAESEGQRRPFIPYRESVLTYLLKESLGGNSRTAMIATVSPCSIHVEETLSTLRYAQQARKIVNHNYINEDPTALIIRSLKEEVERLRLQQLRSPSLIYDGDFHEDEEIVDEGEKDKEKARTERENYIIQKEKEKDEAVKEKEREIAVLQEQLRCQQLLSEQTRSLEQRLKETEAQQQQALESLHRLGIASEKETGPVLINLSEDPQFSEKLSYVLKDGTTSIGHSNCDLTLHGLHTENVHCSVVSENGNLKLFPKMDADTYINGRLVTSPETLQHNDRLVLAGIYFFRVKNPGIGSNSSQESSKKMDFYFTKEELLKEQEKRLRKEAEIAIAASKAEMEEEMCHQRNKLLDDVEEARSQLMSKQCLVSELEGSQWKLKEEKRLLEEQIVRDRKIAQSLDLSLQPSPFPHSNFLKEVEAVFNETVEEVRRESTTVNPPMLSFRIKEANQICKKLKKPFEFMMQEILNESGLKVVVLVKDLNHQMTATLTEEMFAEKLQVLRDIIQGEEREDEMFEASLIWERTEDVSCVPGFINKLLECPSLSAFNTLNCSFNKSLSSYSQSKINRRRSGMLCAAESSSLMVNASTSVSSGSVIVATAIHQALTNLPASNAQMPPLTSALNAATDLHRIAQDIGDHTTEPGHTLSDEELSKQLILLLCTSQVAVSSLITIANVEITTNQGKDVKLQDKLRRTTSKISSCTSRLFQGVKNEVDSLIEEESRMLTALALTVIGDIARSAILLPLPVPDFTRLKAGGLLCRKFTDGLVNGLDSLVINSGDIVRNTADSLAVLALRVPDRCQNSDGLLNAAHSSIATIAAFLKSFSQLNATIEYDENQPEEDQRLKTVRWVNRVESAAETITQLTTACTVVKNQVELLHQDKMNAEELKDAIEELLARLQQLMSFAALSPTPVEGSVDCSFSSKSDTENGQEFMTNLHNAACHSIQEVQKLQNIINKVSKSCLSESMAIKYNKNLVNNWPKNSIEYIQYLKQLAAQKKNQMKSSLRSSSVTSSEEKRVRFDVSSSVSCFEETDTVEM